MNNKTCHLQHITNNVFILCRETCERACFDTVANDNVYFAHLAANVSFHRDRQVCDLEAMNTFYAQC